MSQLPLDISAAPQEVINSAERKKPVLSKKIVFAGYNKDIVEPYYWHLNFAYFNGKGYFFIKLEDHHYFSENSQFGANIRQMKGGSIRALQENLQQMVQLIKVHLMPLLKEIKEADFYKNWLDQIVDNDEKYQQGLSQGKKREDEDMKKWAAARDEAINHLKDKWVNEVDGGRIWQMTKPATEQGLDFSLLPQLFFGTKLDNPLYMLHGKGKSIKEQLDEYTYKVDVSLDAITAVARFQYRFYTWLPSVIKETDSTFKIKISSLKQFYAQLQMYIQFMKPLLVEIAKKSEGFEKTSMFYNFEEHNPEFWNLLDYSYSFVRLLGIRKFEKELGSLETITIGPHGLFVDGDQIPWGKYKKQNCIIFEETTIEDKPHYRAKKFNGNRDQANALSKADFEQLETITIDKYDLVKYSCIELGFSQKRRNDIVDSPQGPAQVPYMTNTIDYSGLAWNVFEIATYREFLRQDDLALLETFIEEIGVIKEDLLHYVSILEGDKSYYSGSQGTGSQEKSGEGNSKKADFSFLTLPFEGVWSLFSPLVGDISLPKKKKKSSYKQRQLDEMERDSQEFKQEAIESGVAEDLWKGYTVFKKSHGFIQY